MKFINFDSLMLLGAVYLGLSNSKSLYTQQKKLGNIFTKEEVIKEIDHIIVHKLNDRLVALEFKLNAITDKLDAITEIGIKAHD